MRRISFYLLGSLMVSFGLSYGWPALYEYSVFVFFVLLTAMGYNAYRLSVARVKLDLLIHAPPIFTLGDANKITVTLKNIGTVGANLEPTFLVAYNGNQLVLQHLLFENNLFLKPGGTVDFSVLYNPKTRGMVFIKPLEVTYFIGPYLLRKSLKIGAGWPFKVYPSLLQMKQFNLLFRANWKQVGRSMAIKKVQEGFGYELEQILPFTAGDDTRKINWRVSGRKAELMVNRYLSDRRRDVYLILDSSRPMMQEGADNMSIFEYAINLTLMLANVILQKGDRCGLLVVGKRTEIKVSLGGGQKQLNLILESLYRIMPTDDEGDFYTIERLVGRKGILLICTHEDQAVGVHLPAFKKLLKLFPTIPIWLAERTSKNVKATALQAGSAYLSHRSG